MYEKIEIEQMLRNYLLKKSQLESIEDKINKNDILLKYNQKKYEETDEETIEGMALHSPEISVVPKRKYK